MPRLLLSCSCLKRARFEPAKDVGEAQEELALRQFARLFRRAMTAKNALALLSYSIESILRLVGFSQRATAADSRCSQLGFAAEPARSPDQRLRALHDSEAHAAVQSDKTTHRDNEKLRRSRFGIAGSKLREMPLPSSPRHDRGSQTGQEVEGVVLLRSRFS